MRPIIEELSGQIFEIHLKNTVFETLGFEVTIPDRATAYRTVEDELELFPLDFSPTMYAAAGLNISATALGRWLENVLAGRIVPPDILRTIGPPRGETTVQSAPLAWAGKFPSKKAFGSLAMAKLAFHRYVTTAVMIDPRKSASFG